MFEDQNLKEINAEIDLDILTEIAKQSALIGNDILIN